MKLRCASAVAIGALFAAGLCLPALAQNAALLPNGKQVFVDANGAPLAGGSVGFYIPNTLTPKTTWADSNETTPNQDPVGLDAAGSAVIYGSGQYREIVKDANGNTIWDELTYGQGALPIWGGTATGTGNAIVINAGAFNGTTGQEISFLASATNTAGVTLVPQSGAAPIAVDTDSTAGPAAVIAGTIVAGNLVTVVYDAGLGVFHLLNPAVVPLGSTTISPGAVTNAKLANMPADTIKGNNTAAPASPLDLTGAQVNVLLPAFTGDAGSGGLAGLVPAPAAGDATLGKILGANGGWNLPGIGTTQGWAAQSRSLGISYQNTVGQPIEVSITINWAANQNNTLQTSSDNSTWVEIGEGGVGAGGAAVGQLVGIIPNGWYYRLVGTGTFASWTELR